MTTMTLFRFALLSTAAVSSVAANQFVQGTVQVDEFSLPILANGFNVLLKVDKSYAYGDLHDEFKSLAKQYKEQATKGKVDKDFIVATMGVESYGDKENEEFAKSLGADADAFPEYFYVEKGKNIKEAVKYSGSDKHLESIVSFVKEQAGIRIGTGILEDMDKVAAKFVAAANEKERESVVKEATDVAKNYENEEKNTADVYLKILKKAMEKGNGYFETETSRVKKMLKDGEKSMKEDKKSMFKEKLKVLASFTNPIPKDEL